MKARSVCNQPGCDELEPCPNHPASAKMREYNQKRRAQGPAFYDSPRWRKLRTRFLRANPRCVKCGERATDADHIVPRPRNAPFGSWDSPENLQPLCSRHHKQKTMTETNARVAMSLHNG